MRYKLPSTLALIAAAAFLHAAPGAGAETPRRPNIVYILADDLGYGELGSYGQAKIRTPNLDRLAAEGMRFTQHYSGSPVCAPSRATFMSGTHTGHTLVKDNFEFGGWTDENDDEVLCVLGNRDPEPLPAETAEGMGAAAARDAAPAGDSGTGTTTSTSTGSGGD